MQDHLTQIMQECAQGYVQNLVAAEQAVLAGQFNLAKVLRAVAYAQRALAMNAARHLDAAPADRLAQTLVQVNGYGTLTSAGDESSSLVASSLHTVAGRIQDVLARSQESLDTHPDVPEWSVAQRLFTCIQCGNLVEENKPDICDVCGAFSVEFEVFGPFYASDDEHLGQLSPDRIMAILTQTPDEIEKALVGIDEARLSQKPSPEEWSIKEIMGHIFETDELFVRRIDALLTKSTYSQPVPPWKTHEGKGYESMSKAELLAWMHSVRSKTLERIAQMTPQDWVVSGFMLGGSRTVLDIGTWLANHDRGHFAQIRRMVSAPQQD
ncbi:MAG: DinB family protein [Caldilineaceae bacterium]|nr:DinB family protein [Caldilineaceae bacterium]MBP8123045.1 DinB family protein [Caldilineaceae bacterium]MBP9073416.1 DinB family protein [Caldilineaceae bacterium]